MNEKLSALLDNELSELDERRVLSALGADPALRAAWERYHLIRAAMRRELDAVAPGHLPGTIAKAIAAEPSHRAGRRLAVNAARLAGGLAIAAAVATVAIINFPLLTPGGPVTMADKSAPTTTAAARDAARPSANNPLDAYLVEHNEFAPTAGMANMLPYVRTVNHDNNRPDNAR